MNQPNKEHLKQSSQKVVYDHIIARLDGGVHVKNDEDFKSRTINEYLPAGTAIKKDGDDYKVIVKTTDPDTDEVTTDYTGCIGLTENDIKADDFPLVSIVVDAVIRLDAIPEVEKESFALIKEQVPGLKFY